MYRKKLRYLIDSYTKKKKNYFTTRYKKLGITISDENIIFNLQFIIIYINQLNIF